MQSASVDGKAVGSVPTTGQINAQAVRIIQESTRVRALEDLKRFCSLRRTPIDDVLKDSSTRVIGDKTATSFLRIGKRHTTFIMDITVTVLYFASLSDLMGCDEQTLKFPSDSKVEDLLNKLEADKPDLLRFQRRFRVALNQEFVELGASLEDGAEVALIPPVSGGSGIRIEVGISQHPLSLERAVEFVQRRDCGAVVTFLGTVRDLTGEQVTERLDYSAYHAMAEKEMHSICQETIEKFAPLGAIYLTHRIGSLQPGEAAVIVAVSSPHRDGAFQAARYLIDTTKDRVPLWKKEIGPDGQAWIEGDARIPSRVLSESDG